jgi:hypothetical protein
VAALVCLVDALTHYVLKAVLLELLYDPYAEWHMTVSQNEPSVTISSSVIVLSDCYGLGSDCYGLGHDVSLLQAGGGNDLWLRSWCCC